jgi:hypothetical protein
MEKQGNIQANQPWCGKRRLSTDVQSITSSRFDFVFRNNSPVEIRNMDCGG